MRLKNIFTPLLFIILLSCESMTKKTSQKIETSASPLNVPVATQKNKILTKHGDQRNDPYFWMNERDSKDVLSYIEQENNYAESILKKSETLNQTLFAEMKSRILENDSTAPYKKGSYFYYTRFEKGKDYPIYCRKKQSLSAPEEILLDVNPMASGKKYYSAQIADISPNENWIAIAIDDVGRRFYNIHFKNLKTQEIIKASIPNTTGNWTWANDEVGFYSQQNKNTLRSERIHRYDLKTQTSTEVYFEKDDVFSVAVSKSLNGRTIFIISYSTDSTEYWHLNSSRPLDQFQLFLKREKKHEYNVIDGGDSFFIRTNWKAKNFRLMKTPYLKTAKSHWVDVIPHRQTLYLQDVVVFKNFIASEVRDKGLIRIEIKSRQGQKTKSIAFPEPVYVSGISINEEFDPQTLRYGYMSMVQPQSTYDYHLTTGHSELIKKKEVPNYNSELYTTERFWARAQDGVRIPVSLVYRKDQFKKSKNPLFVYGYGSYGHSIEPSFNSNIISLLDRGFIYAIAHVRGGQELGRDWFENGRLMKKKNTFTDFIAATEDLLKSGYGQKGHVYAQGGSAGGLLMGAIMNLRPDLYHGVHAAVPFVDVVTTMLDDSIPLTTAEYDQWGNPNEKKAYTYIKSYSPYDNVKPQKYPNTLITTGYHDSQVQYWEPLKWAAKLRTHNTGENLVLMKTEMGAGHSGVTGRFSRLKDQAKEYAFIVWLEESQKK